MKTGNTVAITITLAGDEIGAELDQSVLEAATDLINAAEAALD